MTPTFVIVPVRNEWHLTEAFLTETVDYSDRGVDGRPDTLVLDNGSTDETAAGIRYLQRPRRGHWRGRPWLHRTYLPGRTVYELWNTGFARAKRLAKDEPFNVLVSNNDIQLPFYAITRLGEALRETGAWAVYPDVDAEWYPVGFHPPGRDAYETRETHGVFGDGGMFGACFMLAGEKIPWAPLITDPAYHWWYGDNHLAECIELAGGKQVRVVGLPVKHVNEGTARHYPELWAKKLHDRGSWVTRHQRGYGVAP